MKIKERNQINKNNKIKKAILLKWFNSNIVPKTEIINIKNCKQLLTRRGAVPSTPKD